ncbi:MAG: hypothetical protein AMXMBFR66_22970 [Pseudomonadota bacterium]
MSFKTTAIAAAAALASLGAYAQQSSQVSFGGFMDASVRSVKNSAGSMTSLSSGNNTTSRLVVRGTEDLGGGWKAGFWLEGTMFADTGTTLSQFWDRQSNVRLSGPWGEVRLGRDWVPSFLSYAAADVMGYVGVGGVGSLMTPASTTAMSRAFGAVPSTLSRSNNAVEYWLPPNLGGFYGQVMAAPGEGANATGNFKLYGARLGYRTGGLDISGHMTSTRIDASGSNWSQSGVTGLYATAGGIDLRAAWVDTKYMSSKQTTLFLGVRVPMGPHEFKASYGRADQKGTNAAGVSIGDNDAQLYALSYVYNLSKRSALYANAATLRNKGAANFSIAGGPAGARPGTNHDGYEVGMRHAF